MGWVYSEILWYLFGIEISWMISTLFVSLSLSLSCPVALALNLIPLVICLAKGGYAVATYGSDTCRAH